MKEWHIYIDGASMGNPGDSGAGILIQDGYGNEIFSDSFFLGYMTNNRAEYEALLRALYKANLSRIMNVYIYTDSLLITNQIKGIYKVKDPLLQRYVNEAKKIIKNFKNFEVKYIPREKNRIADRLAKNAAKEKGGRQVVALFQREESPGIKGQDGL